MNNEKLKEGIFIGGPHACAMVYEMTHVEAVIKALCEVTGDDQDEYTATDLNNPITSNDDLSAFIKNNLEDVSREIDEFFEHPHPLFK